MTRRPYLCGNWKMNLDRRSALDLIAAIRDGAGDAGDRDVGVAPPYVYIDEVARALAGSSVKAGSAVKVGAQNCCDEASGAFTGEVSASMLRDVGASFVILGHSERRHVYGEPDELVNRKVHRVLGEGLEVILCCGETIEERQAGRTEEVVRRHLSEGLAGVDPADMARITVAYEPVWAIGTGHVASPEQAGEVHTYLRGVIEGLHDAAIADATRIQYGGSVKPDNVDGLMAVDGIDGALVGGASLKAVDFLRIITYSSIPA